MEYVSDKIFFNGVNIKGGVTCDNSYRGLSETEILDGIKEYEDKQLGLYAYGLVVLFFVGDYNMNDIENDLNLYREIKSFSLSDLKLFYGMYKDYINDFNFNGTRDTDFGNVPLDFKLVTCEVLKTVFKIKVTIFEFGHDGPDLESIRTTEMVFKIK